MTLVHVVDAHAYLWYVTDNPRLGNQAGAVLDDQSSQLVLPAIALAEICWAIEHGKVPVASVREVLNDLAADPRFRVAPLTTAVIERSHRLGADLEMHDRQIVATALLLSEAGEEVRLLTQDPQITSLGLVNILW